MIRKGTAGYIVTYGEMVYRSLDAVERLKKDGIDVGLINKPTLNVVDEDTIKLVGKSPFVLVVESLNQKTGLGSKVGRVETGGDDADNDSMVLGCSSAASPQSIATCESHGLGRGTQE